MTDIASLRARIEELERALDPFAKEAAHWETFNEDEPLVEGFEEYDGNITVGDLRRARTAHKGGDNGK